MMRHIFIILAVLLLLCGVYILILNWDFVEELEYRLSRYHTFGEISVMVDGQEMNTDGMLLHFTCNRVEETVAINGNVFRLRTGEKGMNEYRLSLPLSAGEMEVEYLDILIEHFNHSWWYVHDMTVSIDISTEPILTASMSGSIFTRRRGGPEESVFEVQEKAIHEDDNLLHARTRSP